MSFVRRTLFPLFSPSLNLMQSLKFAVATSCFRLPLRAALKAVSQTRAQGVVFDARYELTPQELSEAGRRQLLHLLAERGLTVAGLHFPLRRPLHDADRLDQRMQAIKSAMSFGAQVKATVLTVPIGPLPPVDAPEETQRFSEILEDLANHGNHVGVQLAVLPHPETPERINTQLDAIRSGFVGINFDPAIFLQGETSLSSAIQTFLGRILHVELRDVVRTSHGGTKEVAVGRGEVDWMEVVPSLVEIEYRGWLTASRGEGNSPIEDCANAIAYAQNVGWGA